MCYLGVHSAFAGEPSPTYNPNELDICRRFTVIESKIDEEVLLIGAAASCPAAEVSFRSELERVLGCGMWCSPFPKFLFPVPASNNAWSTPDPCAPSTAELYGYRCQLEDALSQRSTGICEGTNCRSKQHRHRSGSPFSQLPQFSSARSAIFLQRSRKW